MKLLKEPLVHFAVAGALMFGVYEGLHRGEAAAPGVEPVRIGDGELRWLSDGFTQQWQREPTDDELRGLLHDLLVEELLAREAESLGLAEGDTVVRRRLAQKLTFLIEDTRTVEPTEDELRRYQAENGERFRKPARVSFVQVYFNPARRTQAASDAEDALLELSSLGTPDSARGMGDPLLLDMDFKDLDEDTVSGMFGPKFAAAVFALEPGSWHGPFESGYGLHLVFVTEASRPAPREFEEVKREVLAQWRQEREREVEAQYLAELRAKYGIVLEGSVETRFPQLATEPIAP